MASEQTVLSAPPAALSPTSDTGEKIPYGSPVYNQIAGFYIDEALLLDENRLLEWGEMLAEDLIYTAPMRTTRWNEDTKSDVVRSVQHFDDNYTTICLRIRRLTESKNVWAENPRARTRRFVTNVSAHRTNNPDEFAVTSYILLMKTRGESSDYQFVTARRNDLLRLAEGALKIAKREFIVDMSVLGVPNLINFL